MKGVAGGEAMFHRIRVHAGDSEGDMFWNSVGASGRGGVREGCGIENGEADGAKASAANERATSRFGHEYLIGTQGRFGEFFTGAARILGAVGFAVQIV